MCFALVLQTNVAMQQIDFQQLNEATNSAQTLQTILFDHYGVSLTSWRKNQNSYSTKEHGGLKITNVRGTWIVIDFSGQTIGDSTGRGAKNLVKHAYGLKGKEAAEKLSQLTGEKLQYTEGGSKSDYTPPPRPTNYLPNVGTTVQKYFDNVTFTDWSTPIGQAALDYIQQKTKADFEFIKARFRPIASTEKEGKTTIYTPKRFAYQVLEGLNARIFRPYLKQYDKDKMPLQLVKRADETMNYVFGFSDLPLKCKLICILGGEHDTTAFNYAFNKLGWYAVTKGGEGGNLEPELVEILRGRCDELFTIFDNDDAGRRGMDKQANQYGLLGIDLATYVNDQNEFYQCVFDKNGINRTLNDVSDIVHHCGADFLKTLILNEIATKKPFSVMPYRPTFHSVWKATFNTYLSGDGGAESRLQSFLARSKKIVLKSATGSGKNALSKQLADNTPYLDALGIERTIVLVPTIAIARQQAKELDAILLIGGEVNDDSEITQSRKIVMTYDQLKKMPSDWSKTSLFIIDEIDNLVSEYDYRSNTMRRVQHLIKEAEYVLGITATPNYEFIHRFGLSLCVADYKDSTNAQKVKITPIIMKTGASKDVLADVLNRRNDEVVTVLKLDNTTELRAFSDVLSKKFGDEAVTVISSKFDETYIENDNYKSLIKDGTIGEKVKFVLCTKFLEAGVNFKFAAEIFYIYPTSTRSIVQMLARPRFDRETGRNSLVNAFIYLPKGGRNVKELAHIESRFEQFVNENRYELPIELTDHKKNIERAFNSAKGYCEAFNNADESETANELTTKKDLPILYENGMYEVDELRILSNAEGNLQSILRGDIIGFFAELQAMNPNISLANLEIEKLEKDIEVRDLIDSAKADESNRRQAIAEKLTDATTEQAALVLAHFESKNAEQRAKIESELGRKPLKEEVSTAKERINIPIEKGDVLNVVNKYIDLKDAANSVKYADGTRPIKIEMIKQNLPTILVDYDLILGRVMRLSERFVAKQDNTRDYVEMAFYGSVSEYIRKQVFDIRDKTRRRELTQGQMTRIYNDAIKQASLDIGVKKIITEARFDTVKKRFEELFNMHIFERSKTVKNTEGVKKRTETKYTIGEEVTAKNVLNVPNRA